MKKVIEKIIRVVGGLFLFTVGIVMTINANLGLAPWDVFHQGLSKQTNLTMGEINIIVGFIILIINIFLGERVGWSTIANMILIGVFMDILMLNNLIPSPESIIIRIIMMFSGLFIIGVSSCIYIGVALGSGPRDGLMIALTKKTNKSVRFIRNSIEITVFLIGYFLGGSVGVGTFVMAFTVGYFIQFAFKIFKFDVNTVQHRFIDQDIIYIKEHLKKN